MVNAPHLVALVRAGAVIALMSWLSNTARIFTGHGNYDHCPQANRYDLLTEVYS